MNQTRKITTETWIREFTDPASGVVMGQATFYPERGELYPPHIILKEEDMRELLSFLDECLAFLLERQNNDRPD